MEQKTIFAAVLNRLLESFAPTFNHAILLFENYQGENSIETLQKILDTFPRESEAYKHMIKTLTNVASCNPSLILTYIAEMFEELMNSGISSEFTNLRGMSPMFKQDNKYHDQLFENFMHLFMADLICIILQKYGPSEGAISIINCGFELCSSSSGKIVYFLHPSVLKQWSVIFSLISKKYSTEIINQFEEKINSKVAKNFFQIVCYLQLDLECKEHVNFIDFIVQLLEKYIKERVLNVQILLSVSKLISTTKESPVLNDLFDLIYKIRNESDLKEGTFDLLASLFLRMPKKQKELKTFYKKRVFGHAGNNKKVARSMRLFQRLMFGTQVDIEWLSWNWSIEPPKSRLCFINWNSQPNMSQREKRSFTYYFMKYFYKESDFSVCPLAFSNTIVHIASLDFEFFKNSIFPIFFDLDINDPRFIVLLHAVQSINSSDFIDNAFKPVVKEQIEEFNKQLKPKIIEALNQVKLEEGVESISFFDIDPDMKMKMEAADQKVSVILHDWDIDIFGPINIDYNESEDSEVEFTAPIQLVRTLTSVLDKDDFASKKMINMCLRLSFNQNRRIASAALQICLNIFIDRRFQLDFVEAILNHLRKPASDESLFVCIKLLLNILEKGHTCFKQNVYHDIELVAYVGFVSIHPSTRYAAFRLLLVINKCLDGCGSINYIRENSVMLESIVKQRVLSRKFGDSPELPVQPIGSISFNVAILTHYFDIWLIFISEIVNVLISVNYTPMIRRFYETFRQYISELRDYTNTQRPTIIGILILYISAHFHLDSLLLSPLPYKKSELYEPFCEMKDSREEACIIIKDILDTNEDVDQIAFAVIPYVNYTLFPQMLNILSFVRVDQLQDATETVAIMLRSPLLSNSFFHSLLPQLFSFLAIVQSHFIHLGINSPRVIEWTQESENEVIRYSVLIKHYCLINSICFSRSSGKITEEMWSIPSREIVFRFLINWSTTHSLALKVVREYAKDALVSIVKVGKIFSDALIVDNTALTLFSQIEQSGSSILSLLLYFHAEDLLELYIDECYIQSPSNADHFFEAIFMAFDAKRVNFLHKLTGNMMLLGLVMWQRAHPRAKAFILSLIDIISQKRTPATRKLIDQSLDLPDIRPSLPRNFSYAAETLIAAAFRVVTLKGLSTSIKDIVEAVKPWFKTLRLLPNQTSCISDMPSDFHRYTPYQFLIKLMEATEAVGPDNFTSFAPLWSLLLKIPDHTDLIPLFISSWPTAETKQKLFSYLITTDTVDIIKRIAERFSFAYYFHATEFIKGDIKQEFWVFPLLVSAIQKGQEEILDYIPNIVHFAFLFSDIERSLLDAILKQYSIPIQNGPIQIDSLPQIIRSLASKFMQTSDDALELWGEEALRWLFGSKSLKLAYMSLLIYNQFMIPNEPYVTQGICRAVIYHMKHVEDENMPLLTQLIGETFKYFTANFAGNESFAFQFASSFFDCKPFVETCLPLATRLFILSLSSQETSSLAWNSIISIVRPLLISIETDPASQKIFDFLIKSSNSEELKLIIAPIKAVKPNLFPSVTIPPNFLDSVTSTTMCNALVHYAMMINTASSSLMNTIFEMSSSIVNKIVDENNRTPLTKLYKAALGAITTCPKAVDFIITISKREPSIVSKSSYEFYGWSRPLEDVIRSVKRLVDDNIQPLAITDCQSVSSVVTILNGPPPKIKPFITQNEMINGMKRIQQKPKRKREMSIMRQPERRLSAGGDKGSLNKLDISTLKKISVPKSFRSNNKLFTTNETADLIMSPEEFLSNY